MMKIILDNKSGLCIMGLGIEQKNGDNKTINPKTTASEGSQASHQRLFNP